MYIRIDLSVFFVTQNVGETSKVEFSLERKIPCFCPGERNLKKEIFQGEESLFVTWQNSHWHHQKQTTKKTSSFEDVENLEKGVSHYFMMLLLVLQK